MQRNNMDNTFYFFKLHGFRFISTKVVYLSFLEHWMIKKFKVSGTWKLFLIHQLIIEYAVDIFLNWFCVSIGYDLHTTIFIKFVTIQNQIKNSRQKNLK